MTSKTCLEAYENIGVRELWIYDRLTIYGRSLQTSRYTEQPQSPTFSNLPIVERIKTALRDSRAIGRSPTLRQVHRQLRMLLE